METFSFFSFPSLKLFLLIWDFYFLYVNVLFACIPMHHLSARCLRPGEGVGHLGLPGVCWESSPGPGEELLSQLSL